MTTTRWSVPVQLLLLASLGAMAGMLIGELWTVAATANQPLLWWAGRASGLVAYGALWLSMLLGLAISSKGAGGLLPKKLMMDLHQQWTLSAVVATVVHVLTIVLHAESHISAWAIVVPFASARLTGAVALGTIALFGLVTVSASSWLRAYIPYQAWRSIHALAFGTMLLALGHAVTAGTDAGLPGIEVLYVLTSAVLVGAIVTRVALTMSTSGGRSTA